MGFWVFLFAMALLIPVTMIGFGHLFLHKAPKTINCIFGYRTPMSMKNNETWAFAHHYCGRLWCICGWVLLAVSVVAMVLVIGKDEDTVSIVSSVLTAVQLVPLIGTIFPTERALRKNFNKDGTRKTPPKESDI